VVGSQREYHPGLGFCEQPVTLLALLQLLAAREKVLLLGLQPKTATTADFTDPTGEHAKDEEQAECDAIADIAEPEPGPLDEETRGHESAKDRGYKTGSPSTQPPG
jgi:hypothetical protein